MKRLYLAVLALLLLAGCSNAGQRNTTGILPSSSAASASSLPNSTGSQAQAAPLTISGLQAGFGRKVGTIAASFGDTLYYYKEGTDIYAKSATTGDAQSIRQLSDDNSIYQIFTDEVGNLYYCTMGYDNANAGNGYFDRLYRYDKNGDVLLAENINAIVRVDKEYIFFDRFVEGSADAGGDKLCALRLKDGKVFEVANPGDIPLFEAQAPSVDYAWQDGNAVFTITNASKQKKTVTLLGKALGLKSADEYPGECVAFWDEDILLVSVYGEKEQTMVYRIDTASNKVLSNKKFTGAVDFNATSYKGKAYFCIQSEASKTRYVYSMDLAMGNVAQMAKVSNFHDDDDAMYMQLEIESDLLFVYGREEGDGVFNGYYSAIPLT